MAACKSCGASITWTITKATGKNMPVDAEPSVRGNLVVEFRNGGYESRFATDEDRQLARPMHTSHFATCPDAPSWRNR